MLHLKNRKNKEEIQVQKTRKDAFHALRRRLEAGSTNQYIRRDENGHFTLEDGYIPNVVQESKKIKYYYLFLNRLIPISATAEILFFCLSFLPFVNFYWVVKYQMKSEQFYFAA